MPIHHIEASIVVAASDCNPTILNPDFLSAQGIVPKNWGWELAGPPITTPQFATLSYNSGVSVTVETNRFQVVDGLSKGEVSESRIPDIARKYVEVLPHVRYGAVGHNFRSLIEHPDAENFLKERFLKAGIWDNEAHRLEGISLKFVYPLSVSKDISGKIILSIDGAVVVRQAKEKAVELKGVLAHANFHRECSGYPTDKQVVQRLGTFKSDWDQYQKLISDIVL